MLYRDGWPSLNVLAEPRGAWAIGEATGAGWVSDPENLVWPPWRWWRLRVGKAEVPGMRALVIRQFLRVDDS